MKVLTSTFLWTRIGAGQDTVPRGSFMFNVASMTNHRRRLFLMVLTISLFCFLVFLPSVGKAETSHRVYFKGTDAELDVYTITGSSPGPTLLLLGGIQGDEPGGFLAADLYADVTLRKGNMFV